jgi:hypothetical protein
LETGVSFFELLNVDAHLLIHGLGELDLLLLGVEDVSILIGGKLSELVLLIGGSGALIDLRVYPVSASPAIILPTGVVSNRLGSLHILDVADQPLASAPLVIIAAHPVVSG